MRYEVVFDPQAVEDIRQLRAHLRGCMAARQRRMRMKRIALSEVKDDLSRYLHVAEQEQVIITRHGRPAGVLIGFKSDEDWFDYRLQHDPRFLKRIAAARGRLRKGKGVKFEDITWE